MFSKISVAVLLHSVCACARDSRTLRTMASTVAACTLQMGQCLSEASPQLVVCIINIPLGSRHTGVSKPL